MLSSVERKLMPPTKSFKPFADSPDGDESFDDDEDEAMAGEKERAAVVEGVLYETPFMLSSAVQKRVSLVEPSLVSPSLVMADLRARKLRPIYEALDSRNFRGAVKLCNNKQVAKLGLVRVLKAHALNQMGRSDEALALCNEVKAEDPTDEPTLSTMATVYRGLGQLGEAMGCYEKAYAADPDNEEMAVATFFCYVRADEGVKQKQHAMGMYKRFQKAKYLMWASVSMVIEASSKGPAGLALAEKMMAKALGAAGDEEAAAGQASQIHVRVLRDRGNFADAIALLRGRRLRRLGEGAAEGKQDGGDGGESDSSSSSSSSATVDVMGSLLPCEESKLEGELCLKAAAAAPSSDDDGAATAATSAASPWQLRTEAHMLYRYIVTDLDRDEWEAYTFLVASLFELADAPGAAVAPEGGQGEVAGTAAAATVATAATCWGSIYGFLLELQAGEDERRGRRGPFLAEIHLLARLAAGRGATRGLADDANDDAPAAAAAAAALARAQHVAAAASTRWQPAAKGVEGESAGEGADGADDAPQSIAARCLAEAMVAYLGRFGHKQCCVGDLLPFVSCFLPGESPGRARLINFLERMALESRATEEETTQCAVNLEKHKAAADAADDEVVVVSSDGVEDEAPAAGSGGVQLTDEERASFEARKKRLRQLITARQMLCVLVSSASGSSGGAGGARGAGGAAGGEGEGAAATWDGDVNDLWSQYTSTRDVNVTAGGGQREVQYGDDLVTLAASLGLAAIQRRAAANCGGATSILDAAAAGASSSSTAASTYVARRWRLARLLEIAVLLETGLANSGYNFRFKLLLVHIYGLMGAFEPACLLYNDLQVKHIQLATMSQLLLGPALRCGFLEEAQRLCMDICEMHVDQSRDIPDAVRGAFVESNYCEAVDFMAFRERLRGSQQRLIAQTELGALHLCAFSTKATAEAERFLEDALLGGDSFSADNRGRYGETMPQVTATSVDEVEDLQDLDLWQSMSFDNLSAERAAYTRPPYYNSAAPIKARPALTALLSRHLQLRSAAPWVLLYALRGNSKEMAKKLTQYSQLVCGVGGDSSGVAAAAAGGGGGGGGAVGAAGDAPAGGEEGKAAAGSSAGESKRGLAAMADPAAIVDRATASLGGSSSRAGDDLVEAVTLIGTPSGNIDPLSAKLDAMLLHVFETTRLAVVASEESSAAAAAAASSDDAWKALATALGESQEAVVGMLKEIAAALFVTPDGADSKKTKISDTGFCPDSLSAASECAAHHLVYISHTATVIGKSIPTGAGGGKKSGGKKGKVKKGKGASGGAGGSSAGSAGAAAEAFVAYVKAILAQVEKLASSMKDASNRLNSQAEDEQEPFGAVLQPDECAYE